MRWITFQPIEGKSVIVLCADLIKQGTTWKVVSLQTCIDDWRYRRYCNKKTRTLCEHLKNQGVFQRKDYVLQACSHDMLHPEYDFCIESLSNGDISINWPLHTFPIAFWESSNICRVHTGDVLSGTIYGDQFTVMLKIHRLLVDD